MENQIATGQDDLIFEPQHLTKETIKKYLCATASDQELMMGLQIAKTFKLNPLKREVYFVKYKADQPMQVLVGYEVYLKRAERSGKYDGLEITSEGKVEDGTLKAIVKVFRKDWSRALIHEAYYSEYVQMKKDFNTGKEEPNKFWKTKPVTMIKKVAVSQAFRMAFPDEFDGMPYTSDEVIDTERVEEDKIEEPLKMPTPKPIEIAPATATIGQESLKTLETENPKPKPENAVEKAVETFKGTVISEETEYINQTVQEDVKRGAKQKGFTAKTFKEWLMFNFEIASLEKIPAKALGIVTKRMQTLPNVGEK